MPKADLEKALKFYNSLREEAHLYLKNVDGYFSGEIALISSVLGKKEDYAPQ